MDPLSSVLLLLTVGPRCCLGSPGVRVNSEPTDPEKSDYFLPPVCNDPGQWLELPMGKNWRKNNREKIIIIIIIVVVVVIVLII